MIHTLDPKLERIISDFPILRERTSRARPVKSLIRTAAGASMFAYAVLRHRVIDLGFAVNRTLIYGTLSAILLADAGSERSISGWLLLFQLPDESQKVSSSRTATLM